MEAKTQARVEQKAGDESCGLARAVVHSGPHSMPREPQRSNQRVCYTRRTRLRAGPWGRPSDPLNRWFIQPL